MNTNNLLQIIQQLVAKQRNKGKQTISTKSALVWLMISVIFILVAGMLGATVAQAHYENDFTFSIDIQRPLLATNDAADTDGDGIPDTEDLDDDNDGILDTDEGLQSVIVNNPSFEEPVITYVAYRDENDVPYWETTATDNKIELWESGTDNGYGVKIYSDTGRQHAELNAFQDASLYQDITTTPGTIIQWYIAHRGRDSDSTPDVATVSIGAPGGTLDVVETMSDTNTEWGHYSGVYVVPAGQTTTRFSFDVVSTAGGDKTRGNFLDSFSLLVVRDTDGDGVPDHLDLDSDNDGISDLSESDQDPSIVDTNNDGILDSTTDNDHDGLMDTADADDNDPDSAGTVATKDTDNDGIDDHIDLDSDNDGIPDVVEAQPTDGYQGNDGNVSDNVDDNGVPPYGLVSPQDTDGDGTPDYLDTDSDNDGTSDTDESGLALTGNDNDNDGIDDGVNASYQDPDGDVNEPLDDLQNTDADPDEADYRSVAPYAMDDAFEVVQGHNVSGNVITDDNGFGEDSDPQNDQIHIQSATVDVDGDGAADNLLLGTPTTLTDADGNTIGTVTLNTDGSITFNPDSDFTGPVPDITYTLVDEDGNTDDATIYINVLPDADGDGIADVDDLDDDNDGIPDSVECTQNPYIWSQDTQIDDFNNASGTINNVAFNYHSDQGWVEGSSGVYHYGNIPSEYNVPNNDPTIKVSRVTTNTITFAEPVENPMLVITSIGNAESNPNYSEVPVIFSNPVEVIWSWPSSTTGNQHIIIDSPTQVRGADGDVIVRFNGIYKSIAFTYSKYESYANVVIGQYAYICDTDGDGIPNNVDLDSDNDGISDLIESGQDPSSVDKDNDGILDSTTDDDHDGLMDTADTDDNDPNSAGTVTPKDTDDDGIDDYIDLDSDNDGIPDVVEAQPTNGYQGNDGNVSDNVDDNGIPPYGLVSPQDTDGDGTPDYLDTDSDNDGTSDTDESDLTLTGNDNDNDGIDDGVNASYQDPDGDVDNPMNDLKNDDGTTDEVDYRSVDSLVAIGDRVWFDKDEDGSMDDTEEGIDDVKVQLYQNTTDDDVCDPSSDTKVTETTTANGGYYQFTALTPSTDDPTTYYCVVIAKSDISSYSASSKGWTENPDASDENAGTLLAATTANDDSTQGDDGYPTSDGYIVTKPLKAALGGQQGSDRTDATGYPDNSSYFTVDFGFHNNVPNAVSLKSVDSPANNNAILWGLSLLALGMLAIASFAWWRRQNI